MTRERIMWIGSAVLLIWIGLLTLDQQRAIECAGHGGRWQSLSWRCVPDPGRIIIQREIRRSQRPVPAAGPGDDYRSAR